MAKKTAKRRPSPMVGLIMGSQSDWATMRHTAETLEALGEGLLAAGAVLWLYLLLPGGAVNDVFDQHIAHVDERMRELAHLKLQLTGLRQRCQSDQSMQTCGILQGLAAMETETKPERHTHLG